MARSRTIYRTGPNGETLREDATDIGDPILPPVDYHEQIKRTYYELECAGKLNDMSPRSKAFVRDVHTYAQNPAYWDA